MDTAPFSTDFPAVSARASSRLLYTPGRPSDSSDLPEIVTDPCLSSTELPAVPLAHQFLALTEPERDPQSGDPIPDNAQQEMMDDRRSEWLQLTTSQISCQPRAEKADPTFPPSLTAARPRNSITLQEHRQFPVRQASLEELQLRENNPPGGAAISRPLDSSDSAQSPREQAGKNMPLIYTIGEINDMNFEKICGVLPGPQSVPPVMARGSTVSHFETNKFFKVVQVFKEVTQRFHTFYSEHRELQETIIQKLERTGREKVGTSTVMIMKKAETIHNPEKDSEALQKLGSSITIGIPSSVLYRYLDRNIMALPNLYVSREVASSTLTDTVCSIVQSLIVHVDRLEQLERQQEQALCERIENLRIGEQFTRSRGHDPGEYDPGEYDSSCVSNDYLSQQCSGERYRLTLRGGSAVQDVNTEFLSFDSQDVGIEGKTKVEELLQGYMLLQEQLKTLDWSFQAHKNTNDLVVGEFTMQLSQLQDTCEQNMQGIRDVITLKKNQEIWNEDDQVSKTLLSVAAEIAEGPESEIIYQNRRAGRTFVRRTKSMDGYLNRQGDDIPQCLECEVCQATRVLYSRAENQIHLLEEALTAAGVEIPVAPIGEALEIQQSSSSATQMLDNSGKLLGDLEERYRRQLHYAERKHNKKLKRVYDRYEANRKEEIANFDQRLERALYRIKYLEDQRKIHRGNIQVLLTEKAQLESRLESVLHWGAQRFPHIQQHRNAPPQPIPGLGSQGPPAVPGLPPYCHIPPGPWQQLTMPYTQDPMVAHHLLRTEAGQAQFVYPPSLEIANQAPNLGTCVLPDNTSHDHPMSPKQAEFGTEQQLLRTETEKLRRERGNFQGEISRLAQLLGEEKEKYLSLQNHLAQVKRGMDLDKAKFSVDRQDQSTIIQKFQQENQNLRLEGNSLRLKIAGLEVEVHNLKHSSEELNSTNKSLEKDLSITHSKSQDLNLKQDIAVSGEGANLRVVAGEGIGDLVIEQEKDLIPSLDRLQNIQAKIDDICDSLQNTARVFQTEREKLDGGNSAIADKLADDISILSSILQVQRKSLNNFVGCQSSSENVRKPEETEINELHQEIVSLKKTLESQQDEFSKSKQVSERREKRQNEVMEALKNEVVELKEEKQHAVHTAETWKKRVEFTDQKLAKLEDEQYSMKTTCNDLDERRVELEMKLKCIEDKLQEEERLRKMHEKEKKETQKSLREQSEGFSRIMGKLTNELNDEKEKRLQAEKKVEEIETIRTRKQQVDREVQSYRDKHDSAQKALKDMKAKLALADKQHEEDNALNESRIVILTEQRRKLDDDISARDEVIEDQSDRIKALTDLNKSLQSDYSKLKDHTKAINTRLDGRNSSISDQVYQHREEQQKFRIAEDDKRTRAELAHDLYRAEEALIRLADALAVTKNQVWNAVVMLASSRAELCDADFAEQQLPAEQDVDGKTTVPAPAYITCLRTAKYLKHELLGAQMQIRQMSTTMASDHTAMAYIRLLGEFAVLVKRLIISNMGSFPEDATGVTNFRNVMGECLIEWGDLGYWKSIIFDYLNLSNQVPLDGMNPGTPTTIQFEPRLGVSKTGGKIWVDLERVEKAMASWREHRNRTIEIWKGNDSFQGILSSPKNYEKQVPLDKMVLLPERVLKSWIHGPPQLQKGLAAYLKAIELRKEIMWKTGHGEPTIDWKEFRKQMDGHGPVRPESLIAGGGSWLSQRPDVQLLNPPMSIVFPGDSGGSKKKSGEKMCVRCGKAKNEEGEWAKLAKALSMRGAALNIRPPIALAPERASDDGNPPESLMVSKLEKTDSQSKANYMPQIDANKSRKEEKGKSVQSNTSSPDWVRSVDGFQELAYAREEEEEVTEDKVDTVECNCSVGGIEK